MNGVPAAAAARTAQSTALVSGTLLADAAAGDRVAFARLVAAYHADLVRVAFVVCGDDQLAQDAAQSAWAIAWCKLGTLRDPAKVRPWLTVVAANEARRAMRGRRREHLAEIRLDAIRLDLGPGARAERAEPLGDDGTAEIERVDLGNALRHLSPDDRALLALRFIGGFDAAEIAAARGMSPSGVRGRLSRVIGRLRKELGDA